MRSVVRKAKVAAALVVVVAAGLAWLVLASPQFADLRGEWIADRFTDATGLETEVGAGASLRLGEDLEIELRNVRLGPPGDPAPANRLTAEIARFTLPVSVLWGEEAPLRDIRLSGAQWDVVDAPADGLRPPDREPFADDLRPFDLADIVIRDGIFRRHDGVGGAVFEIPVERLTTRPGEGGRVVLEAAGMVGGRPVEASGGFDYAAVASDPARIPFALKVLHPGFAGELEGELDGAEPRLAIDAAISARTRTTDALAGLVGVKGRLTGSAELDGRLRGPVSDLTYDDLTVVLSNLQADGVQLPGASGHVAVRQGEVALDSAAGAPVDWKIETVELAGVQLDLLAEAEEAGAERSGRGTGAGFGASELVAHLGSTGISIRNSTVHYREASDAWRHEFEIASLVTEPGATDGDVRVRGSGTLNGEPLSLEGTFLPPPADDGNRPVQFRVATTVTGLDGELEGGIHLSSPTPSIEASVTARSQSLDALLDTLGYSTRWDSAGRMTGRLEGPLDAPALNGLEVAVERQDGFTLDLGGRFGDVAALGGLELAFSGTFAGSETDDPKRPGLRDMEMRTFEGRVTGSLSRMAFEGLRLETNLVSAELKEIGPITIGRAYHDANGELRLEQIRVADGPPGAPYLDLAGSIGDALSLAELQFAGRFNIAAADALVHRPGLDVEALGRLQGTLAVSDRDGTMSLDRLDASIVESSVLAADVQLKTDENGSSADSFVVEATVDNLARLAAALGHSLQKPKRLRFDGIFAMAEGSPTLDGTVAVGDTVMNVDLTTAASGAVERVSGSVRSRRVGLDDLYDAMDAALLLSGSEIEISRDRVVVEPTAEVAGRVSAQVRIDVDGIEGVGDRASRIEGQLAYHDEELTFDPLTLVFLGGTMNTTVRMDLGTHPVRHAHSGTVRNLPLGRLLEEVGVSPTVTGTVNAQYNLSTAGTDFDTIAANLSGSATPSLWNSTIDGSLIDLTGMNAVSWLFSGRSRNSHVECVVAPLRFENGRAATDPLVVETKNVQLVGEGTIDLANESLDLAFEPRALHRQGLGAETPFRLTGDISNPKVDMESGAGRVAAELITMPLNIVGWIFGGGARDRKENGRQPCEVAEIREATAPPGPDRDAEGGTGRADPVPLRRAKGSSG